MIDINFNTTLVFINHVTRSRFTIIPSISIQHLFLLIFESIAKHQERGGISIQHLFLLIYQQIQRIYGKKLISIQHLFLLIFLRKVDDEMALNFNTTLVFINPIRRNSFGI